MPEELSANDGLVVSADSVELLEETGDVLAASTIVNLPTIKDPNLGTIVDSRFQLLENVGSGGSSTVYRARDRTSGRVLALKLLHSHFVTDGLIVDRFKREAETSKLLRHPNVVDVESWAVSESGQVYMTEEFVEGISLQDAIAESGWLSVELTLAVAAQICSGLAAAHEMGVVHCDLKPGNIMLTRSPEGLLIVKVLDFGIAKIMPVTGDTVMRLTQSGNMQGSVLYMSPEQCLDEDLDGRSDVYSLACVIYEAVTGKPPLCSRTTFETMNRHLTVRPQPLATVRADLRWPDKLEGVLSRAYAKKPKERYQSMAEFQAALQKVVDVPVEIEWPDRWTKKSERIEADLKVSEIVPAAIVSAKIVSLTNPVALPPVLEPKQSIEILLKELEVIPAQLAYALISSLLAVALFMVGPMVAQPGSAYISEGCFLFGLIFMVLAGHCWYFYLDSLNIQILSKVSLSKALTLVRKLQPQPICIIEVTRITENFYNTTIEFVDADGKLVSEKVVVRSVTIGHVWSEFETNIVEESTWATKPLLVAPAAPVNKLQYPLPGYLFSDDHGNKIAISILSDVGWIYSD